MLGQGLITICCRNGGDQDIRDVAILRLEQLYPFPDKTLAFALKPYSKAQIVWCQEEPENMGAWNFADRRIERVLTALKHRAKRPVYVGRVAAASPATGLAKVHAAEQASLVRRALTWNKASRHHVERTGRGRARSPCRNLGTE